MSVDGTAGRSDRLRRASAFVSWMDAICRRDGIAVLSIAGNRLSAPAALQGRLTAVLAAVLEGSSPAFKGVELRTLAVRAKRTWQRRLASWRRPAPLPPPGETRVVFQVRHDSDLDGLLPVARALVAHTGAAPLWLVYGNALARRLRSTGEAVVQAEHHARLSTPTAWRLRFDLERLRRTLAREAPPRDLCEAAPQLLERACGELQLHADELAAAAVATTRLLRRLRPRVVVVGNPCILEGAAAIAGARAIGAKLACLQHGEMVGNDPRWAWVDLDAMFVYGAVSAEALRACGFDDNRIIVTGSPTHQARDHQQPGRPDDPRPMVLVALSGPGHQIGLAEHERTVARILRASSEVPMLRWVFRLHPKDDPGLYERLARSEAGSGVQIIEARASGITIQQHLQGATLLVTQNSMAALDAMAMGVPVVSVDREAASDLSRFVLAGATTRVGAGDSVGAVVDRVARQGPHSVVQSSAAAFVGDYFGPSDGAAAERIVAHLAHLLGSVADRT